MQIEEGKYYLRADGKKVGPMRKSATGGNTPWFCDNSGLYSGDGRFDKCDDYPNLNLVAEWPEEPQTDNLKTWRDMTDAEKGALLLAHHEGRVIEANDGDGWFDAHPFWSPNSAYRVKPEPKRETVNLWIDVSGLGHSYKSVGTIDLVDGKPDCDSIKMEEL